MSGNTAALTDKTIRREAITPAKDSAKVIRAEAPAVKRASAKERLKNLEAKAFSEVKNVPGVSVFAIIGTIIVSVLMVFVVLAQVSYNEAADEAVRLSAHLRELTETHRMLELAFESSFDIEEVERIARDELGMSKPDSTQIVVISSTPRDTAVVIEHEEQQNVRGFADFLRSLTDYFRK